MNVQAASLPSTDLVNYGQIFCIDGESSLSADTPHLSDASQPDAG